MIVKKQMEFPWPTYKLSPNARLHRMEKARVYGVQKHLSFCLAKSQLCSWRPTNLKKDSLIGVTLIVTPPIKRRRDEDNLLATCKALLDGLADALCVDDSLFHFREQEWMKPKKPGGLKVLLDMEVEDYDE